MKNERQIQELREQIAQWRLEAERIEDMIEAAYSRIDELVG
ncbi:hypothetical protein [Paenibacillus cremeus]|nr:hypothetical protein [Paenibacillus cremeus]